MRNKENIQDLLQNLQNKSQANLTFDEDAIVNDYEKKEDNQSLAIKILSVLGGLLASIAFIAFLFISNLFDSKTAMLIFGGICIAGALFLNRISDKIITDTLSVSSYLIGFVLVGISLVDQEASKSVICIIFLIIAVPALFIVNNYMMSFVSLLIINGSILALITLNEWHLLINIYTAIIATVLTFIFLTEAKFMMQKNRISQLYEPLRSALVFTFLGLLIYISKFGIVEISPVFKIIVSVVILFAILYIVSILFSILKITNIKHKIMIAVATVLLLAPTIYSPAISGTILIILLSFLVNYKTGFALGIIGFIYSISMYYYDLHFTLLTKSIILFSSGILFLMIYLFTHKKLMSNEKV